MHNKMALYSLVIDDVSIAEFKAANPDQEFQERILSTKVIASYPDEAFHKFEDEHGIVTEAIKLERFLDDTEITFRGWDN